MNTKIKTTLKNTLRSQGLEVRRSASGRHLLARFREPVEVEQLVYNTFFRDDCGSKVMIEVGAARPDLISQGALFRSQGWRVLSVEPNPRFAELHRARGHEIYQYACSDSDMDDVEFSIVHAPDKESEYSNESYSSLSIKEGYAALTTPSDLDIEKIRVKMRRLDSILQTHAPEVENVECLAIDVEGWELEVLSGFDLERFAPRVVVVENLLRTPSYQEYMRSRGYRLWKTIHPDEIYVKSSE